MSVRLGDVCGDRDNNLNLIRIVAAGCVLISHAYPIALGKGAEEPLDAFIGMSLGAVSVGVFFAASGFLIARSYDRKARLSDWIAARVMRLLPGLAVVLLVTMFLLGPAVTELPLSAYFFDLNLVTYFVRNLTLFSLQYNLSDVFAENIYGPQINGSLWTLVHGVLCYGGC